MLPKTTEQVRTRIAALRHSNEATLSDRHRVRALMNGGKDAVSVLLPGLGSNEETLPAANHIKSGVERFSEMIAGVPSLRVDPPAHRDSDPARKAAEKRERIVENYDRLVGLDEQVEQLSLWLPGYGFGGWRLMEKRDRNGHRYPAAELRDPYTTWLGAWGTDGNPTEVAFQYHLSPDQFASAYPHLADKAYKYAGGPYSGNRPGWDGTLGGFEVIEYLDGWGIYESSDAFGDDLLAAPYEHPLDRPPFVVARRTTFDELKGQFSDSIGLAASMAKLTLLTQIAMEDAVFSPIVVTGRMDGEFIKGRDAVNYVEDGAAGYLTQNVPYQMFQEIDRIEAHLRSNTGYSKQADGESPMSFVTGKGLEELGSSLSRQVDRYQRSMARALVDLDAIRLEWDENAYPDVRKTLDDTVRGGDGVEHYVPATHIAGHYGTRRVYGMMASWDEPTKIVGGLQLLSAGVIDLSTFRENLSGLDNIPRIEERRRKDQAENVLFEGLMARAQQGDPAAEQLAFEVWRSGDVKEAFEALYKAQEEEQPQQPQLGGGGPPDLDQVLEMMAGGGAGGPGNSQVLSRLTGGGNAEGGAQTVAATR